MLMVVFGAGASYDSVDIGKAGDFLRHEFRPPLTKEIFAARDSFGEAIDKFPAIRSLVSDLRGNADLEPALELLATRAEATPFLLKGLLALRYYLREILTECGREWFRDAHGVTNYHRFLVKIREWQHQTGSPVCFVTFNYDTFLEQAVADVYPEWHIASMREYINRRDCILIKPHGSVSWGHVTELKDASGPRMPPDAKSRELIAQASRVTRELVDEYSMMKEGWNYSEDGRLAIPAIAVPVQNKSEFECPTEHLSALQEAVHETSALLTIGWRGTEKHFLRLWTENAPLLASMPALVVTTGRQSAGQVRDNFNQAGVGKNWEWNLSPYSGFSGFLDGDQLHEILK